MPSVIRPRPACGAKPKYPRYVLQKAPRTISEKLNTPTSASSLFRSTRKPACVAGPRRGTNRST